MPQQEFETHTFANGMVLVAEPMEGVESAAFSFLVPAGTIYESTDKLGVASLTTDMMLRGCGSRDSRAFLADLENLGVQRGESVSATHVSVGGATVAENLAPTLEIYADLLLRPHLRPELFEAAQQVVLQELCAIEDDASHKTMLELRRRYYPDPWGRNGEGTPETVEAATIDDVGGHFNKLFRPNGTILGVAGKIDFPRLVEQLETLFGDWRTRPDPTLKLAPLEERFHHMGHESQQTHIGVAYQSVPFKHPDYLQASGAVGVLSGGMSARLFTEVREKRGLCYSVYASYHTHKDLAGIVCYAGTNPDRAQETLDVMLNELRRLPGTIEDEELQRLRARVKSGLIMQQESSASRAGSIAREWFHLGRVRSLDEIGGLVDGLTAKGLNEYLDRNPPANFTIVTLGPEPLKIPDWA
ncbi:MAG: pitrilysin family protein [Pirellulales bacterium]